METITTLLNDKKDRDTEIKCLTEEKEQAREKVEELTCMVEEVVDEILEKRSQFEKNL